MPSLNALREFKSSFDDIGGQKADFEARNLPFDDLELPDFEPEPLEAAAPPDASTDAGADTGVGAETSAGADFSPDFSHFLNTNLDDLPAPPLGDDEPAVGETADTASADTGLDLDNELAGLGLPEGMDISGPEAETPAAGQPADDFGIPDDLLSGLSDELAAADTPPAEADFDLGDLT
jgi:hypothetical protein